MSAPLDDVGLDDSRNHTPTVVAAATARWSGAGAHRRLLVLAIGGVAILSACGGSSDDPDKYKQTWTKGYGETTCADWRDVMDEHQRFVMAADVLYSQQLKLNPDVGLPDDALVNDFKGQVQGLCLTNPADDVTTAMFIVWTTGDQFKP